MNRPPDGDEKNADHQSRLDVRTGWLERRFAITARGSSVGRELVAGLTTFAAMVYIVAINPAVMASAGMDRADVVVATALVAIVGSIATGAWANLPIGLAPSMASNAFFAFVVVGRMGLSWRDGLGVMLVSGVIVLLLGVLRIRERLTRGIPDNLKVGLTIAFGIFLCRIAIGQAGITSDATAMGMAVPLAVFPIVTSATLVLAVRRFPAALIVSVLLTTIVYSLAAGHPVTGMSAVWHPAWPHWPSRTAFAPNFGWLTETPLEGLTALTFVTCNECVGLIATTVTVTHAAHLDIDDADARAAYVSDASATIVGSLLGTATVSPFIESVAGVEAGGRTGLTAVVVGVAFMATLFFAPLFASIPSIATAPAIMVLGGLMTWRGIGEVRKDRASIATVAAMAVAALGSGNLTDALTLGIVVHLGTSWKTTRKPGIAVVSCFLFVAAWLLSKRIP